MVRYHVRVYDRAGEVAHHTAQTAEEARDLAAILRRQYRGMRVVIEDAEREGHVVDEDPES
jgi:hypothetical protein